MSDGPPNPTPPPADPSAGTSAGRRAAFWAILLATPVVLTILAVQAYYLHAYLTLPAFYCGSFAQLDGEVGWVLKPGAESCIGGTDPDTGDIAFEVPVFINRDGARAGAVDAPTPNGSALTDSVLVIGDSWSFGYGIAHEDTFAARLESDHGIPAALFASPAYSGAQAVLLGERAARLTGPSVIVYLEMGFLWRAVCTGTARPADILKPCYWTQPGGRAEMVLPRPGAVEAAAARGLYPGGIVGAGENSLSYFLISRPVEKLSQLVVRLGLASGFGDDFGPAAPAEELEAIRLAHAERLVRLAAETGARVLLIDPASLYADLMPLPGIDYVDQGTWQHTVAQPAASLTDEERRVPADNHYGPGMHRLIASMIAARLTEGPE